MGGKKSRITNRVRDSRKAAGLSQAALGDHVGATRQTIIAIEGQRYSPSLELAFRISHALGESIEELFQFSGEWD
ncbi:helix-turn-helix transcriptional regulator [Algimonas porphyrae]|uniref:Transcriptional regulator n=1 Tax=Algimonas porphyrae TaxID=1128113 RepID=A0ABQ5UZB5_9PROT|nr:helix-turn-helix transcriptional regulator [Algimonas porphyrae]GLQ20110.1 transcriptional regulator [Algimonas porphyrae]